MAYYDDIYDVASDNFGLITSAQAKALGVSDKEMCRIAKDGRLTRVARGLYRVKHFVPEENDPYAVAVAAVGPGAYLYGESVLAMLGLCPTDPRFMHVATPKRVRRALPPSLRVVKRPDAGDRTVYDGVPSQSAAAAIASCGGSVPEGRLRDAMRRGREEGYITAAEEGALKEEMGW